MTRPSSSRRTASLLAAILLLAVFPASADKKNEEKKEKPKPALGATSQSFVAGEWTQTVLPGKPLDAAPWPGGGLAVLVAPEDDPEGERALYRLQGQEHQLMGRTADDIESLALVTLAGGPELWLGARGKLYRWQDGAARLALAQPGLLLSTLSVADSILTVPGVRGLRRYRQDPAGAWQADSAVPLPAKARRISTGLEIKTLEIAPLQLPQGEIFALGPEALGPQRLRTILVDPTNPDAAARQREVWSKLPRPEKVEQHRYLAIDGKPYLLALTVGSEALNIFEQLTLRVLPLRDDRTRSGAGPAFSFETVVRRWFEPDIRVADFDGDGKSDLLLFERQGMDGDDLWLTLLLGKGGGRFDDKPLRRKLEVPSGRFTWGHDLDADGRIDLLVETSGELRLYPGQDGGKLLATKSAWVFAQPAVEDSSTVSISVGSAGVASGQWRSTTAPQVLEIDGDARPELFSMREAGGRALVRVVDLK